MTIATHDDIARLFPGISDHVILEILETGSTLSELEAALVSMTDDGEDLIEIQQREGTKIHRLLSILNQADIEMPADRDG
jgi:hypothetical protein